MSTRASFYLLESDRRNPLKVACQLAIKAWEKGQPVSIIAGSAGDAARLDKMLWADSPERFIPHNLVKPGKARYSPITIGVDDTEATCADVTINLSADPILHIGSRILEIIAGTEDTRNRARKKYAHYKQLGYKLEDYKLN